MDTFLEKYHVPKLNEGAECLNRTKTAGELEEVIKKLLAYKRPGLDGFTGEFYKTFKEELTPIRPKLLQKFKRVGSQNLFVRPESSLSQNQIQTQQRKKTTG